MSVGISYPVRACGAATMFYRSYVPAPPLAEFVEWFWYCADVPTYARARILPSGTVEMVFNLRDDEVRLDGPVRRRLSGAVVSGAYGEFLVIDPMQHASMIGVHFRPGGAAPFLGTAAGDLTDAHADLETLWGGPPSSFASGFARPARRRSGSPFWSGCSRPDWPARPAATGRCRPRSRRSSSRR